MGIDGCVHTDSVRRPAPARVGVQPGDPQSLSPFESRSTTLAVLWATLIVSSMVLLVCWVFWI